ncbi:MAG: NADH-quinone oxidoreductase subunit A, partial [Planctomycetota bacterium]
GMDPIHDTRRRFDVRFYLLAIAFLVFDVELLFLYPWAVMARPARRADSLLVEADNVVEAALEEAEAGGRPMDDAAAALLRSDAGQQLLERRALSRRPLDRHLVFVGVMVFVALLALGFIYDWRKGIFRWR